MKRITKVAEEEGVEIFEFFLEDEMVKELV